MATHYEMPKSVAGEQSGNERVRSQQGVKMAGLYQGTSLEAAEKVKKTDPSRTDVRS
jgi:hypothetical protein